MNAVGCVPRVHIINAVWQKKTDLHIAISCNAVGRGVGVSTARHRLSTQTQCTIRATAWDRESHAGYGSRKRSGVPCGSSLWRGGCGGGSHPTCPNGRSASLTKRGSPGSGAYGDPMRNPMWDLARDPWFHGRLNARSVISHGIRSSI